MKDVGKILRAIAETIEKAGFPQEPFIVQSDPREEYSFFLVLWRTTGKREVVEVGIKRES